MKAVVLDGTNVGILGEISIFKREYKNFPHTKSATKYLCVISFLEVRKLIEDFRRPGKNNSRVSVVWYGAEKLSAPNVKVLKSIFIGTKSFTTGLQRVFHDI